MQSVFNRLVLGEKCFHIFQINQLKLDLIFFFNLNLGIGLFWLPLTLVILETIRSKLNSVGENACMKKLKMEDLIKLKMVVRI